MRPAEDHKVFLSAALYNQSRSAWKTACHKYCGNIYMAQLLLVTGTINSLVVRVYNQVIEKRRQKGNEGGSYAGPASSQSRTMLAEDVPLPHLSQSRWRLFERKGKGKGKGKGKEVSTGSYKGGPRVPTMGEHTNSWGSVSGTLHECVVAYKRQTKWPEHLGKC